MGLRDLRFTQSMKIKKVREEARLAEIMNVVLSAPLTLDNKQIVQLQDCTKSHNKFKCAGSKHYATHLKLDTHPAKYASELKKNLYKPKCQGGCGLRQNEIQVKTTLQCNNYGTKITVKKIYF